MLLVHLDGSQTAIDSTVQIHLPNALKSNTKDKELTTSRLCIYLAEPCIIKLLARMLLIGAWRSNCFYLEDYWALYAILNIFTDF